MTGSADDGPGWQPHIRSKEAAPAGQRFQGCNDSFQDRDRAEHVAHGLRCPLSAHRCMPTKADAGPRLMQADRRVNRVFPRTSPGGVCGGLSRPSPISSSGLAPHMKAAAKRPHLRHPPAPSAVIARKTRHRLDLLHGLTGRPDQRHPHERWQLLPAGRSTPVQENGKQRWLQVVAELSRAFAPMLAATKPAEIRDDVEFLFRRCRLPSPRLNQLHQADHLRDRRRHPASW